MTLLQTRSVLRERPSNQSRLGFHRAIILLWLGLIFFFALSSIITERAGSAPTVRNLVFGRLTRDRSYGQTFVASPGKLIAVRVLLFAGRSQSENPVTLRLRDAKGDLPELATVALPLHMLDQHTWTTFDIQPLTLNLTTTLRLDLEAPDLPPSDWITVMAGHDTYPNGELLVDGKSRSEVDLAFQPVYQHRWIDTVLPITGMALGKPGLLGWPPLYALLAYSCIIVSIQLLLALWHTVRNVVDAR